MASRGCRGIEILTLAYTDTIDANVPPGELLVKYSRRPEMASVFNYASMAHNNHFFFNCLVRNIRHCGKCFLLTVFRH